MKDFDVARSRFTAAMNFLKQQPNVDPAASRLSGYCFGGGVVLNMARQGMDMKALQVSRRAGSSQACTAWRCKGKNTGSQRR
jgi:dienelactone hydrolase